MKKISEDHKPLKKKMEKQGLFVSTTITGKAYCGTKRF